MIYTRILPQVAGSCRKGLKNCCTVPKRLICNRSRNLPVWRPWQMERSPIEDFLPYRSRLGPFAVMDNMARMMDKMMEEVSKGDRFWPLTQSLGGKELDVIYNAKKFEIKLDVSQFTPEEVKVKLAGDKLEISGRHSEKRDEHGSVSREFVRQFLVPKDVDIDSMESIFSEDGTLIVTAKLKGEESLNERVINIQRESKDKSGEKSAENAKEDKK